jgi:DNA-binding GntR family transcriptional regulator
LAEERAWGLGVVERRSTTDQVLQELRAAILSGRMAPGEPLPEASLARAFGTGRSAIREALRHLVQEGLVISEHNRGAKVQALNIDDVVDLYRTRAAIEVAAVTIVLERTDRNDVGKLQAAQARIRGASQTDARQAPPPELIAADIDFHRVMVALAESPRLSRAHEPLAAESQMLLNWHPVYSLSDYVADHQQLLDAIETRDPRAVERVRAHLELSADLIIGVARQFGRPGPIDASCWGC